MAVYIDGAFQAHNTYSVSGTTLTFATAPANSRVITVYHIEPVALGTATGATITANNSTNETVFPTFVDGATGTQSFETDTGLTYNTSSGVLTIAGELDAGSLDISGNADIDGTLEADAITVNGTALASVIAGTTVANATTAAVATTVTITDNESTNENNAVIFTAGGDLDGGNLGLESDGDLYYNPSTGTLTVPNVSVSGTFSTVNSVTMDANNAVIFEGTTADAHETTLTSIDATGDRTISLPNVSGTIPVLAAASATAITSTPEELNILDGVTSTAAELNILDGVTSTAAELNALDGITAVVGELNALDIGSTAVGTAVASKAVILDSNKDYTGVRNFTLSGELDAGSLDVSGNADIDGTLETDALSINGTTVTSTAAELNALDGITAVVGELNALDIGSTAVGTAVASKAVILDSNKDYTGVRNFTISGELDAATLDISGNVDIDGVLETDNLTIGGAQGSDGQVLTSTGSGVGWEAAGGGAVSAVANGADNRISTFSSSDALNGEANLTFDGNTLQTVGSANVTRVGPISQGSGAVQTWNVSSAANTFFVPNNNNTVMNPGGTAVTGAIIQVEIAMGSSVYAIAWQNKFKFGGDGSTPTVTATANKTDIFTFRYNGTVWQEIGRSQNLAQTV